MTRPVVALSEPNDEAFASFGRFVTAPDRPGERAFYSEALREHGPESVPILHVNQVPRTKLPAEITKIERHPQAAQCFLPLEVARYVVVVMPSDHLGNPSVDQMVAFLLPATMGVIYHPNVWHVGATVLDRPGSFAVLMWREGCLPTTNSARLRQ